jgi:endogenous inhibitor of DNA gyrase (YacG/DUF329 family)
VDLARWLTGAYSVPAEAPEDLAEAEPEEGDESVRPN